MDANCEAKKHFLEQMMEFADEAMLGKFKNKKKPDMMAVKVEAEGEGAPEELAEAAKPADGFDPEDLKKLLELYGKEEA